MKFPKATIPDSIRKEAEIALSHYPELANVPITFKISSNTGKSFMLAQPDFGSLLQSPQNRKYNILISRIFIVGDYSLTLEALPEEVMIGWLGHELGHIMDYQQRGNLNLMWFGLNYLFSASFLKKAERTADEFAVHHGMAPYILATKQFILNHVDLAQKYKDRIHKYYLSPTEITEMVNKLNEDREVPELEELPD